jgi:hypothetical protein
MFLGFTSALIVIPGLIWIIALGLRLWRPSPDLRKSLRNTHLVLAPFAILLAVYGFYALRRAEESAEGGGGLLGAFGMIPIVMGLLAGILSIISLWVAYSAPLEDFIENRDPDRSNNNKPSKR